MMNEYYVVDTNVFLAPTNLATHVRAEIKQKASAWLESFRDNGTARLIFDSTNPYAVQDSEILWEYNRNLRPTDLGMQVIKKKLNALFQSYKIEFEGEVKGIRKAVLPGNLQQIIHDPSDRKFVAVALRHAEKHGSCTIVNATDSDWARWEAALRLHNIIIKWIK